MGRFIEQQVRSGVIGAFGLDQYGPYGQTPLSQLQSTEATVGLFRDSFAMIGGLASAVATFADVEPIIKALTVGSYAIGLTTLQMARRRTGQRLTTIERLFEAVPAFTSDFTSLLRQEDYNATRNLWPHIQDRFAVKQALLSFNCIDVTQDRGNDAVLVTLKRQSSGNNQLRSPSLSLLFNYKHAVPQAAVIAWGSEDDPQQTGLLFYDVNLGHHKPPKDRGDAMQQLHGFFPDMTFDGASQPNTKAEAVLHGRDYEMYAYHQGNHRTTPSNGGTGGLVSPGEDIRGFGQILNRRRRKKRQPDTSVPLYVFPHDASVFITKGANRPEMVTLNERQRDLRDQIVEAMLQEIQHMLPQLREDRTVLSGFLSPSALFRYHETAGRVHHRIPVDRKFAVLYNLGLAARFDHHPLLSLAGALVYVTSQEQGIQGRLQGTCGSIRRQYEFIIIAAEQAVTTLLQQEHDQYHQTGTFDEVGVSYYLMVLKQLQEALH